MLYSTLILNYPRRKVRRAGEVECVDLNKISPENKILKPLETFSTAATKKNNLPMLSATAE